MVEEPAHVVEEVKLKLLKNAITMELLDLGLYRRLPNELLILYGKRYEIFSDDQVVDVKSFKFLMWAETVSCFFFSVLSVFLDRHFLAQLVTPRPSPLAPRPSPLALLAGIRHRHGRAEGGQEQDEEVHRRGAGLEQGVGECAARRPHQVCRWCAGLICAQL